MIYTVDMNTLSYFNCLGHQEFENIAHNGLPSLMELERVGWMGRTDGSYPVTTTGAPAVQKNGKSTSRSQIEERCWRH